MPARFRILLIDDDAFVRDALSLGLGDGGFDVAAAADAASGLDLLNREPFDAVVTDMKLPGFDGSRLIGALRANRPELPVIAMSGGGEINGCNIADLAREQGAALCLSKPFRSRELIAALQNLLSD